jgi:hypothetical protein
MIVYLDQKEIDVWEVIDELNMHEAKEVMEHLQSTLGNTRRGGTIQELEFSKACYNLEKNRDMLPREIEEEIISLAKKYTLYQ